MTNNELNWLAGLLEGEGSFMKPCPSSPNSPRIAMEICDKDIADRAAALIGVRAFEVNQAKRIRNPHWRVSYRVTKRGKGAVELMKLLYPLMGQRRKQQILTAISVSGGMADAQG